MPSSNLFDPRISQTVRSVWVDAGIDEPYFGIIPLFDLVASYPIWVSEVEDLSIERAGDFLAEKTGQKLSWAGKLWADFRFFLCLSIPRRLCWLYPSRKRDPIVRRRFSVAHELGHYKLHLSPGWPSSRLSRWKREYCSQTQWSILNNLKTRILLLPAQAMHCLAHGRSGPATGDDHE
jgi:hypothetical protein